MNRPADPRHRRRKLITVGALFAVAFLIYAAFIARGMLNA